MYVLVLIAAVIFFMPTPTIKPNPDQQSDIDNTKSHSASGSDVVNFIHQVDILVLFIFNNKLIHNKKKQIVKEILVLKSAFTPMYLSRLKDHPVEQTNEGFLISRFSLFSVWQSCIDN